MLGTITEVATKYYLVTIHGDLVPTAAFYLEKIIVDLKSRPARHTFFDMEKVLHCSNSALGVLIEYAHYLNETGQELVFFSVGEMLEQQLFGHNIAEDMIPRRSSEQEALQYVENLEKAKGMAYGESSTQKSARIKQEKLDQSLKILSVKALYETKKIRSMAQDDAALMEQMEKTEVFFKNITDKIQYRQAGRFPTALQGGVTAERLQEVVETIAERLEDLEKKYDEISGMLTKIMEHLHINEGRKER